MVGTELVKRVLLVEKNASLALDMLQLLSSCCEVVAVASAQRAVKLLLSGSWDVVVSDFELGRDSALNGVEVLHAAHMLVPNARRVLYATALPLMSSEDAQVMDVFLSIPCTSKALLAALGIKG